jgi:hypothetical protein
MRPSLPALPAPDPPAWREHLLVALTLIVLFLASLKPLANGDTFWHLALGREIWTTGHLVRTETFSFTAQGTPWEDTEWLFHAVSYPAWRALGDRGLPWAVAALATLAGLLAYRSIRLLGGGAASFAIWMALCAAAYETRVSFRPDVISLVFMAILVEGLLRWSPSGGEKPRLWIFTGILFWVWCQLHGGWVYGCALLFSAALGLALDARREGTLDRRVALRIAGAVFAPLAVVWVNPYGWLIPLFPLKHVLSFGDASLPKIAEWQATPWAWSTAPFIAALLGTLGLQFLPKPVRWRDVLWCAGQVALALFWARYAGYAVLTLAPFGARGLSRLTETRAPVRRALWAGALVALVCWGLLSATEDRSEAAALREFPVQEVAYLGSRSVAGRVLHEYPTGGYLEWVAPHRLETFFDGRFFPFAQPMRDYRASQRSVAAAEAFQAKYAFDVAIVPYQAFRLRDPSGPPDAAPRGASVFLYPASRWALVYFGNYGMVFLKRGPWLDGPTGRDEYRLLRPDDLGHLTRAALDGKLDRQELSREISRRLAAGDVAGSLQQALSTALSRLEGSSAPPP